MKPALIFDMDGVLVDNTPVQARAFQLLFRDLGLTTNARQLLKRLNGMPTGEIIQSVFRHPIPQNQLDSYAEQREFLYRTLYWNQRRALPGLVAFLQAARAEGHKIGLGTGSGGPTLSYILDHLDLRRYFDVVIGKDDVPPGQAPPRYLRCHRRPAGREAGALHRVRRCRTGRAGRLPCRYALRGRGHHPPSRRLPSPAHRHQGLHRPYTRPAAGAAGPAARSAQTTKAARLNGPGGSPPLLKKGHGGIDSRFERACRWRG
jgi:phosphoglycolate phosphatase-like HAD superfamily hydrolase